MLFHLSVDTLTEIGKTRAVFPKVFCEHLFQEIFIGAPWKKE